MLIFILLPVIAVVALAHRLLTALAPSNLLISRVRAKRPTFRTSGALAVLAVLLICTAHALSVAIRSGAPGWFNLLLLLLAWDAIKCSLLAAHTTIRLVYSATGCFRL